MTTTPTVWKAQHDLNPAEFSGDVQQRFVSLVDIGLGRHVAVYAEEGNYRGQIFDAEGVRVGGTFPVNVEGSSAASEVFPLALASRPGGGFVAAYVVDGPDNDRVCFDVYDADGSHIGGDTIQASAAFNLTSPSIAMRTDGSFLVTFARENSTDSNYDVVGRRVGSDGTVGDEITIFNEDHDDAGGTFAEAATLANGNYVVAYQNFAGAGDHDIEFKIFGQTGDPPAGTGFQVTLSVDDDVDPQVAALTGGGFVVVWQDSNDGSGSGIMASVFNNSGGNVAGGTTGFLVNTSTSGSQISPDVTALKDGGFLVTWDDEGSSAIKGQRFNAAGTKVGAEFVGSPGSPIIADTATKDHPAVALLGDGRFVIGFQTFVDGVIDDIFDVEATIFDPREKTINGDGNANVITSRLDGATVNGLGGGDTLLGQGSADTLNGGGGVDTMKGRGGDDTYIVDNVGDFPVENVNQGNDLVLSSVSYSLVDNVERLTLSGTAVSGGGNGIANVLTGHDGLNRLDGFDGNDTLFGKGGNDSLFGGNNDDKVFGEAGGDTLDAGSGNDRVNGGIGIDTLTGGAGLDTFVFDAAVSSKAIAAANADAIADFNPAEDTIELAASVFPKLKLGVLTTKAFDSGKKKPAKDKHLVYFDEKKGDLWYDQNGKTQKGKGDVLIAKLDPGLDLTAADIVVA